MALKNKLINHIDKIKEIVLENELLKYAVKSLQKKLEEKNKEKFLQNQGNKKKVGFMNKGTYPFSHEAIVDRSYNKGTSHFSHEPIVDRSYNNIPYGRRNNPITHQIPRRNIRNFVRNVQASLESQRQPPKQSHPKIFIILKKKKFI
jgi:hypothetical protein